MLQFDRKKSYLIRATGEVVAIMEEITPENGKDFRLPELYRMLECKTIEVVRVQEPIEAWLIIDEEGKLANKPVNDLATLLSGLLPHDVIVGHAIYCPMGMLE